MMKLNTQELHHLGLACDLLVSENVLQNYFPYVYLGRTLIYVKRAKKMTSSPWRKRVLTSWPVQFFDMGDNPALTGGVSSPPCLRGNQQKIKTKKVFDTVRVRRDLRNNIHNIKK